MVSLSQNVIAGRTSAVSGRGGWLDRYFYFCMALLFVAIVGVGFSRTVDQNLLHPAIARPLILWIHASAFTAWILFYVLQSALVRTQNVSLHRSLGWFGAALGAVMVPLGVVTSIVMGRFDAVQLHQADPAFLSIPFLDMLSFGTLFALAIAWRKKPELHRRLLFVATCILLDAPFGRSDFLFNNNLFYVALDLVILLGVVRDFVVNRKIHAVYRYAFPLLIAAQVLAVYLWRGAPAWWLGITSKILS